jgi:hypothetical protein
MKISSQEFQNNKLKTAVLFLVFNRPDNTRQVFEAIRQAKPPRLYVAADDSREGKLGEVERVQEVRTIATAVDWPCKVKTLFRDKNLGCKEGVSSAITWFFENEEQGIILEDDCLPHLDFFCFCENLLDRYYSDERIFAITGNNFQNGIWRGDASYYFSKYVHVWGWATWRRAWKHYQGDINFWPKWKTSDAWKKYKSDKIERRYWQKIFDRCYAGQIDTWDYQWNASTWYKNGLTVTPNVNLVSNTGFGENAVHTKNKFSKFSNIPTMELSNITHPKQVIIDIEADMFAFDNVFGGKYLHFPYNWFIFTYRVFKYIFRKIITR